MLLREGEEKFPAVLHGKSPFTASNKRVREPWRHAPLRGGFLPRSYFEGKTLTICSVRPGSASERENGGGSTGVTPTPPPSKKKVPAGQLGTRLLIKDVLLMREKRREVPGVMLRGEQDEPPPIKGRG